MNQPLESQENSALYGVRAISRYGPDGTSVVVFQNGSVVFSDMTEAESYLDVPAPNLRQIDYDNWVYLNSLNLV